MKILSAEEVAELKRLNIVAPLDPTMRNVGRLVDLLWEHRAALIAAAERDLEMRTAPGAQT